MKSIRLLGSLAFVIGLFTSIFVGIPWYVITVEDPAMPIWLQIAIFCLLGGIIIVLMTVALEQKKYLTSAETEDIKITQSNILVINSDKIPNKEITNTVGVVKGHTIYAIWIGNDLSALVRLILGGELTEYTDMMGKARRIATNRMIQEAEELGADAIINVRYMTTSVIGSAAELLAYGTAVNFNDSK